MKELKYIKSIQTKQTPTLLRFCTPSEQQLISGHVPSALFDGGYQQAERKRAYLFTDIEPNITCFQIQSDDSLSLSHQAILGTLMSIGLDRDMIGDILPKQQIFFVMKEQETYVKRHFTTIQHNPITLSVIDGSNLVPEYDYSHHQMIVSSLRMDQIIRSITGVKRQQATLMIEDGLVKRNHQIISRATKPVVEGDLLSIRHYGRFIIDDCTQMTKKGNIIVKYRKVE